MTNESKIWTEKKRKIGEAEVTIVEGQRSRGLGKNMKARVSPSESKHIAPTDTENGEDSMSVKCEIEPTGNQQLTESDFAHENAGLLDGPGPTVAGQNQEKPLVAVTRFFEQLDEFMPPAELPPADAGMESMKDNFDRLAGLMAKSREAIQESAVLVLPTAEEVAAIENGDRLPEPSDQAVKIGELLDGLGPKPNGDYGVLVMVPEQLVAGVLSQAELDGVTPTEWLSVRLGEYLSQWFFGK
jgi:hypothetical protein